MIKSLEGARGVAAVIVAMYHLGSGFDQFAIGRSSYVFVDLFFVLSGFVIHAAYADRLESPAALWTFVIRRFGRLFPLLAFSTLATVLVINGAVALKRIAIDLGFATYLNRPDALGYAWPSALEWASTLTLTHSLGVFDRLILNMPSWSVSTEFYTYLVFAGVCVVAAGRARVAAFALLCLGAFAITAWSSLALHGCASQGHCLDVTYDFGLARCMASFFLGCLLHHLPRAWPGGVDRIQWVALVGVVGLLQLADTVKLAAFLFPIAFALLIHALSSDRGWLAGGLSRRAFQVLGERSYSIYLMHFPLVHLFAIAGRRVDTLDGVAGTLSALVLHAIYLVTLVALSGLTYRYVEAPARDAFNRCAIRIGQRRATPRRAVDVPTAPRESH